MVTLWDRDYTRADLLARVGRLEQVAGVGLVEAGDGAERGVRLLRMTSGSGFSLEVLVDRGFDIGRAWHNGCSLAWWSPVGLTGPWYSEASGLEWLRGFPGGLVSTCGLDHTFLGVEDDASVFGYPHRRTTMYGMHGRYTGLPARLVGYGTTWHGDQAVLWAEGEVVQAAVFGAQLQLSRRIEVRLGGAAVRIVDQVTNIGPTDCPHMLLYHCNIGWPVVDDGAELVYASPLGQPIGEVSSADYATLTAPQRPYVEECYAHEMVADADGWAHAAIINRACGLGVFQRYQRDALPYHITWRQLGHGTYAVGMEPSTNSGAGRIDARDRGELRFLAPGERADYELELGVLVGHAAIDDFSSSVDTRRSVVA